MKNTGFEDALKELGLSEGPGSNGVLPSGGSRQGSDGAACNNILSDWKSFNSSADRAVPGKQRKDNSFIRMNQNTFKL